MPGVENSRRMSTAFGSVSTLQNCHGTSGNQEFHASSPRVCDSCLDVISSHSRLNHTHEDFSTFAIKRKAAVSIFAIFTSSLSSHLFRSFLSLSTRYTTHYRVCSTGPFGGFLPCVISMITLLEVSRHAAAADF